MNKLDNVSTLGGNVPVVALHCSGATAGQWRQLSDALGAECQLFAPEHYGCASVGPWPGLGRFSLADEAARTIELINAMPGPVHLVGHSYGGGLALHIALTLTHRQPGRIASLSLYEPSAFSLLPHFGDEGEAGFDEIQTLTGSVGDDILAGDCRTAAIRFVDYWGGRGAWDQTPPKVQDGIIRWMPKAPLDFHALMSEPVATDALAQASIPTLLIRGEHAPKPTRVITERLSVILADAELHVVDGAGHMGPLTHAEAVNARIVRHIRRKSGLRGKPVSRSADLPILGYVRSDAASQRTPTPGAKRRMHG